MSHDHIIVESVDRFVINPETRVITPGNNSLILVQGDHNSKRYAFAIPRFVEGHDMSLSNRIEIHYDNISTDGKKTIEGLYTAEDCVVEDDTVVFTWLISSNVTQNPGTVQFWINFTCSDEDSNIIYSWGTDTFNNVKIIPNNRNTESVIKRIPDVLEQWKDAILEDIPEFVNDYLEENPVTVDTIPTFNLIEMGLPTITEINVVFSVDADCTEIREAMSAGPVKFIVGSDIETVDFAQFITYGLYDSSRDMWTAAILATATSWNSEYNVTSIRMYQGCIYVYDDHLSLCVLEIPQIDDVTANLLDAEEATF